MTERQCTEFQRAREQYLQELKELRKKYAEIFFRILKGEKKECN